MVIPKMGDPNMDPNYTRILITGTPKMVPLMLGNPHMSYSLNSLKGDYIGII